MAFDGGGTAVNSVFNIQPGTVLDVGSNYTFGVNNTMTGSGATHFNNGILHVTGDLTTAGSFNWSGGTLDGGGVFTVKGGLNITPGNSGVYINGSILKNAAGSEAVISGASATHIGNGGSYEFSGGALTGSSFVYLTAGTALVTQDTCASSRTETNKLLVF